jgi:hypothetical protein
MQKNEIWHECLIHDVEITTFDNKRNDIKLLKDEIETFNRIFLIRELMWLIRSEFLNDKVHSSVKISFRSKVDFDRIMQKEAIVAEKVLKTFEFFSIRLTDQCHKCQKFNHISITCKQNFWTCNWCSENHETRLHVCSTCKSKFAHVIKIQQLSSVARSEW